MTEVKRYTMGDKPKEGERRLHLNEFRLPHHPDVEAAVKAAALEPGFLSEYATGTEPGLLGALAKFAGAAPARVFLGAGSDEVLRATVAACALRQFRTALVGVPSYTHFQQFAAQAGLGVTPITFGVGSLPGDRAGLLGLYERELTVGALAYLGNPNNPTGDRWDAKTVGALAQKYPKSVFLVDEAYIEFEGIEHSLVPLTAAHDNIVVARTFSKAFGLAALRIGYGVSAMAEEISAFISPKSVTPLAMTTAAAVLARQDYYLKAAREVATERRPALLSALAGLGVWALPAGGNFVLAHFGDGLADALARLRRAGVFVRDRSDLPELAGFARVTLGSEDDLDALVRALAPERKTGAPASSERKTGAPASSERKTGAPAPGHDAVLKLADELCGGRPEAKRPIQKFYTPKASILQLRKMFAPTREILTEALVQWWVSDGTLLGAVRHGGIIPWDDDIDLAYVLREDPLFSKNDPLEKLAPEFKKRGLTLQRNRTNAYWQVGTNEPGQPISPLHIDIFPYVLDAKGEFYVNADPRFQVEDPQSPTALCNTRYLRGELGRLRWVPFYNSSVPIPAKANEALDRALGREWRKKARVRSGGSAVDFAITDFTPA